MQKVASPDVWRPLHQWIVLKPAQARQATSEGERPLLHCLSGCVGQAQQPAWSLTKQALPSTEACHLPQHLRQQQSWCSALHP